MIYSLLFSLLSTWNFINSYSYDSSSISVWLSGSAYCAKENYLSMQVGGPATGFKVKDILYDERTDIQGFIGVVDTSIYVVFRGTSSIMNWLDDAEVVQVEYPYCEGCFVHQGFYAIVKNLQEETIQKVRDILSDHPEYEVTLTGHSLGSIAHMMSLEFFQQNISTQVYTFGQPRMGNKKYAEYANKKIQNYWRFTHDRDVVPHIPPTAFQYFHSCGEIFENNTGDLQTCSLDNCEDPLCAEQYTLLDTNSKDHLTYIGHGLHCNTSVLSISL